MNARTLKPGIHWVGAVDWDRRMFDELIPTPDGTSYNAYLVQGASKTALIDTVDPAFTDTLMDRLKSLGVSRLDYVVANHAEQDHSGSLPVVLAHYPEAQVLTSPKGKFMLQDLLQISPERIREVADGEQLSLGDRTLRFIHFPWVHWPETMLTLAEEDRVLFPCDLFGSHLATGSPSRSTPHAQLEAAKRYFAEIMMPFRNIIAENLHKLDNIELDLIAPSHGPVWAEPRQIQNAYTEWVSGSAENRVVIAYVSMHASTRRLVLRLSEALVDRGVDVDVFNLATADLGKLAVSLVGAATVIFGSPTVVTQAHPLVSHAANVVNLLRPKVRWLGVVGSFGWAGRSATQLQSLLPNVKAEWLEPVVVRGLPSQDNLERIDQLAEAISVKHGELRYP